MLNIVWKPISEADKSKTIIGICPERENSEGVLVPQQMIICTWGQHMQRWVTVGHTFCNPTHFIYYEELHESYKHQMSDNLSQQ